jgi:hypothetical protein
VNYVVSIHTEAVRVLGRVPAKLPTGSSDGKLCEMMMHTGYKKNKMSNEYRGKDDDYDM